MQRFSDFKEQRDAATKALADLALGKAVAEARVELTRDRAAFETAKAEETAAFEKHVAGIKADLDDWKRATIAKHLADSEAAAASRAEAERLLADAKIERAAAAKERIENAAERAKLDETRKAVAAAQNLLGVL